MSNFELAESHKEWKTVNFYSDYLSYEIPSPLMIKEAIVMPTLDRKFACRVLSKYEIDDTSNLEQILEENSHDVWTKLTSELAPNKYGECKYNLKLYAFFSLQGYRLSQQPDDSVSFRVFIDWSDEVVERMKMLPEYRVMKDFFEKHSLAKTDAPYDLYRCDSLIVNYCNLVLPVPLRYPQSRTLDYQLMPEMIRRTNNSSSKLFPEVPENKREGEAQDAFRRRQRASYYSRQKVESILRAESRFSELSESLNRAAQFNLKYSKELTEFRELRQNIERNVINQVTTIKKQSNIQPKQSNIQAIKSLIEGEVLHQCQFCYRYRMDEAQYPVAWHCGRRDCKKAYSNWRKGLTRKGIKLEDLRQEGF